MLMRKRRVPTHARARTTHSSSAQCWFEARDCSFAWSNREFKGFCAFAAAPLLVQIVCDGLEEWQHDNVPTSKSYLRRARQRIRTTKRTIASSKRPSEDRFSV